MYCSCGNLLRVSHTGRPAQYCSWACKQRAYRARRDAVTKPCVTKLPDILFYCGLNERTWNHHAMEPGELVCIAPVYGRTEGTKTVNRVYVDPMKVRQVLVDSAAFSDKLELMDGVIVQNGRLSFEAALHRQITHAYQYHYVEQVTHLASYDLLIDETWLDGERSKQRWSRKAAEYAVQQTVQAAIYLSHQRRRIRAVFGHSVGLVLSAQGVDVEQYLRCAAQIVPLLQEEDVFGLGGWCITGLLPGVMLPYFKAVMRELIPYLSKQWVKRVHVWGVIMPEALGYLYGLCKQYGIHPSTDSSGPCRYPIFGNWGYGSWRDSTYQVPPILNSCKARDQQGNPIPICGSETRCRGLERCRHVTLTREWLAHLSEREPALTGV